MPRQPGARTRTACMAAREAASSSGPLTQQWTPRPCHGVSVPGRIKLRSGPGRGPYNRPLEIRDMPALWARRNADVVALRGQRTPSRKFRNARPRERAPAWATPQVRGPRPPSRHRTREPKTPSQPGRKYARSTRWKCTRRRNGPRSPKSGGNDSHVEFTARARPLACPSPPTT